MKEPLIIEIRQPMNETTNYCCIYEKKILDAKKDKRNLLVKTPKSWTLIEPKELLKAELQEKKFKFDEPMRLRCQKFENNISDKLKERIQFDPHCWENI